VSFANHAVADAFDLGDAVGGQRLPGRRFPLDDLGRREHLAGAGVARDPLHAEHRGRRDRVQPPGQRRARLVTSTHDDNRGIWQTYSPLMDPNPTQPLASSAAFIVLVNSCLSSRYCHMETADRSGSVCFGTPSWVSVAGSDLRLLGLNLPLCGTDGMLA
jgi:hypothetical protein